MYYLNLKWSPCILLLSMLLSTGSAWGWGPEGHRLSGMIAEQFLQPGIKKVIREDFSINSLADVSLWADRVRNDRDNGNWHYCNIREGEETYNRKRDCPEGDCVVEKIKQFSRELVDLSLPLERRQEALKYLIHFVGDVHQPLHLGNRKDRGGGTLHLKFRGEKSSLHYLWDGGLIDFKSKKLRLYARELAERVSQEDLSSWRTLTVDDWADESRRFAIKHAYTLDTEASGGMSKQYINTSRQIMELRLSQSGVRLAHLLNSLLQPQGLEAR